jgi:hypothetical protein
MIAMLFAGKLFQTLTESIPRQTERMLDPHPTPPSQAISSISAHRTPESEGFRFPIRDFDEAPADWARSQLRQRYSNTKICW